MVTFAEDKMESKTVALYFRGALRKVRAEHDSGEMDLPSIFALSCGAVDLSATSSTPFDALAKDQRKASDRRAMQGLNRRAGGGIDAAGAGRGNDDEKPQPRCLHCNKVGHKWADRKCISKCSVEKGCHYGKSRCREAFPPPK